MIIKFIIALLMCTLFCVSCTDSRDSQELNQAVFSPDNVIADLSGYTVIRSDIGDAEAIEAMQLFKNAVKDKLGIDLKVATDWVKRGESAPLGTKEILIGATNRPESTSGEAVCADDYFIAFENDRLVINGGCEDAVLEGVKYYVENYIADALYYPILPYYYRAEYEYGDVKIDGIPLSEYSVHAENGFEEQAKELVSALFHKTGFKAVSDEHKIMLVADKSLSALEYEIKISDGQIKLAVGNEGLLIMKEVINRFDSEIASRTSNDTLPQVKDSIESENIRSLTKEKEAEWRTATDERINKILTAENMVIPEGATVFYVSNNGDDTADGRTPETAWRTLDSINNTSIAKGSYVCFERGGLWRGNLKAQAGVTYTAYGTGDKPTFYRSAFNGADPALWTKTDTANVWRIDAGTADVGTLVFNEGEACAIKFHNADELRSDLAFFHDSSPYVGHGGSGDGTLYLYSEENPGSRFDSIEFNSRVNVIGIGGNDITIDNLCIKYCGSHGIGGGTVNNLTVQNCELGWIGGSIQTYNTDWNGFVRYGNAIEIYGSCNGFNVKGNYIYQVYDAGITAQFITGGNPVYHKNITYSGNVIEYCNYSVEYFIKSPIKNKSLIENFLVEDNYMWYAGMGFCSQRPDKTGAAHIRGAEDCNNPAKNFVIKDNLMFDSGVMLTAAFADWLNNDGAESTPTYINNNFVGTMGKLFGFSKQDNRTRVKYTPDVVDYLGDKSNGDIFWFIG